MRRFLLLLLAVIMSTQWTWAAAASVCMHEQGQGAPHFGHHSHRHAAGAAKATSELAPTVSDTEAAVSTFDADCAACHGGLSAVATEVPAIDTVAAPMVGDTPYTRAVTHGLPERQSRPPRL